MSKETLGFLLRILDGLTLHAGSPEFEQDALALIQARKELAAALDKPES